MRVKCLAQEHNTMSPARARTRSARSEVERTNHEATAPPRGGGEGTPYNGLYGEAPPERGTFFRLQVYKRVGISQVEVHKRVGKSVI